MRPTSVPRSTSHASLPRGLLRALVALTATGVVLLFALSAVPHLHAQTPESTASDGEAVSISLDEAVQIALERNYGLRNARLDVDNSESQIRQAWGSVYPQVSFSTNYQRNVRTSNPFAGSSAGNIFSSFGAIDWLRFNEQARADDNPETEPITLEEFRQRQMQGYRQAGIDPSGGGGNPFGVANQFTSGIDVTQTLYSDQAFTAIQTAQTLRAANERSLDRQRQQTIHQVRQAFYDVLLADERSRIVQQSLERTRRTLEETRQRVDRGDTPKMQRLSAEVDLSNLRTQLIEVRNQAELARNQLKHTLGMPVDQSVSPRGTLSVDRDPEVRRAVLDEARTTALDRRSDLERARLQVDLETARREATEAGYMPRIEAFANLGLSGRVPDDRSEILSDPETPFTFSQRTNDIFSDQYWENSLAVGLRVSWNIFTGFQTSAQIQQAQVSINRAELQRDQLEQSVRLEVRQAIQNLETAAQRIQSQRQNLERAELNYEYARTRLNEGMGTPLEERNASEQLDQTRISYLQAVHDYLMAESAFELATGQVSGARPDVSLVSR